MKKKKYLPLYEDWSKRDYKTYEMYLCNILKGDRLLILFIPTEDELNDLWSCGYTTFAWAEGDTCTAYPDYEPGGPFPPLRRNILLLLAAMNGEL